MKGQAGQVSESFGEQRAHVGDVHKNYLFDLGHMLRKEALEAKQAAQDAIGTADEQFQAGRALAYYEVMSSLVSQALTFGLPIQDLHLEGLEPDRDLLS